MLGGWKVALFLKAKDAWGRVDGLPGRELVWRLLMW